MAMANDNLWQEFKPSIMFVVRFLVVYLIGNIVYGLWIESTREEADWCTQQVTTETTTVLRLFGESVTEKPYLGRPAVGLINNGKAVVNVFEGCNGINVMIVFVAFIVAFGGQRKPMAWFIPIGLVAIHLINITRISLLYYVAQYQEHYFYYVHKYIFTAILYAAVFALWYIWVVRFKSRNGKAAD